MVSNIVDEKTKKNLIKVQELILKEAKGEVIWSGNWFQNPTYGPNILLRMFFVVGTSDQFIVIYYKSEQEIKLLKQVGTFKI